MTPSRKMVYKAICILLFFLVGFVLYNWDRCGVPSLEPEEEDRVSDEDYIFEGTSLSVVTPDGQVEWRLEAEKVLLSKDKKEVLLNGIKAYFMPESGVEAEMMVYAGSARVNEGTRTVEFIDKVIMTSKDGSTLKMDKVIWHPSTFKFIGEGNIKFFKEGLIISGDYLEADGALMDIKVFGEPVKISIGGERII